MGPLAACPRRLAALLCATVVLAGACSDQDLLARDAAPRSAPTTAAEDLGASTTTAGSPTTTLATTAAPPTTAAPTVPPTSAPPPTAPAPKPVPTTSPPATTATSAGPTTAAPPPATTAAPATPTGDTSGGWEITVYFTPRESNHGGGGREAVRGCPSSWCEPGQEGDLGTYPAAFLDRVRVEGAGYLTSGAHAGRFLNHWPGVGETGWHVTDAPASASGEPLVPFSSAASSSLAFGRALTLRDCGRNPDGSSVPESQCAPLRNPRWTVTDRFGSPTGARHLDLYVGVEAEGARTEDSPLHQHWVGVTVTLQ